MSSKHQKQQGLLTHTNQADIYQALDANINRCREGLRVVEDVLRFVWKDVSLTRNTKTIRHDITEGIKSFQGWPKKFIASRKSEEDVGKKTLPTEIKRNNIEGILLANIERVKESLRVIEEFSKLLDKKVSEDFKKIRFRVYELEKQIVSRM
jgi:thiamine-phosphate pyrophosphorylase